MLKNNKSVYLEKRIIITSLMVFFLVLVIFGTVFYLYNNADQEGFEELSMEASLLQEDISLQMTSDQENLITITRIGARLYQENGELDFVVHSFQPIGLIDQIILLMSDGTLIMKNATLDVSDDYSFAAEAEKGMYISSPFTTPLIPDANLVASAVPITIDNETVAILYGIIRLDMFKQRYDSFLLKHQAWLFLIEQDTGNILVDTHNFSQGNLNNISTRIPKPGYSHDQMIQDIRQGKDGFTAFRSEYINEYLYARYLPLMVDNWQMIMAKPESIFMAEIKQLTTMLFMITALLLSIMTLYLIFMLKVERKLLDSNTASSLIRKNLLGISKNNQSIQLAMEHITDFAKGSATFFMDERKYFFDFIIANRHTTLTQDEQEFFLTELITYIQGYRSRYSSVIFPAIISVDDDMSQHANALYCFMKSNGINHLCLNLTTDEDGYLSILGIVNAQRQIRAKMLLEEISVCFSMAITNQNYLLETEASARIDGLTGLKNRLAYTNHLKALENEMPSDLCCVFLDVNELHMMNNYLGHAAGDAMLLNISDTLKESFPKSDIYRIGGDEFILFTTGLDQIRLDRIVEEMQRHFDEKEYHVAIGASIALPGITADHLIHQAEQQMYERKSAYYIKKANASQQPANVASIDYLNTGVHAIDAILPFLSEHYLGLYDVSLATDTGFGILGSSHLRCFRDNNDSFRKKMISYIQELVHPDDRRMLLNILNYEVLIQKLMHSSTVQYTYNKLNGEQITLRIHALANCQDSDAETIWIFERKTAD